MNDCKDVLSKNKYHQNFSLANLTQRQWNHSEHLDTNSKTKIHYSNTRKKNNSSRCVLNRSKYLNDGKDVFSKTSTTNISLLQTKTQRQWSHSEHLDTHTKTKILYSNTRKIPPWEFLSQESQPSLDETWTDFVSESVLEQIMDLNHDSNKRLHLHVVTVCLFSDVSGLEVGDPVR